MKTKFTILVLIVLFLTTIKLSDAQTTSWSVVDDIYGGEVFQMATHPTDPDIVYVATMNGVFKTIDGGENWIENNNGLPQLTGEYDCAGDIVIDPNNPNNLFTTLSDGFGIYQTVNGGENWELCTSEIAQHGGGDNFTLAIDPNNSDILYAASYSYGLNKSIDGGQTWAKIKNVGERIFIDPNNSSTLYVGDVNYGGLLYKSTDGGDSWEDITNNLPGSYSIGQLIIDPTNPEIIYTSRDGLWKTINGGAVWYNTGMPNGYRTVSSMDMNNSNTLYTVGGEGIYKTTNGASSSNLIYSNDDYGFGSGFAVKNTSNSNILYANNSHGNLIKSIDAGSNWAIKQSGFIGSRIDAIHFPPSNSNTIMVGTKGAGLHISSDNGVSWQQNTTGLNNVSLIATDPTNENIIFSVWNETILKSSDGGNTWLNVSLSESGNIFSIIFDHSDVDVMYIGSENKGIYKTINGGEAWTQINEGLFVLDVRELSMHPTDPNTIYAVTNGGGVFKTTDAGSNWISKSNGISNWNISSITMNSTNSDILYAAANNGTNCIFKTIDGGENWSLSDTGMPANSNVQDIETDPEYADTIYVATQKNGVYVSPNAGGNWYSIGNELPDMNILCLGKRPEGLYAGSRSKGLLLGDVSITLNYSDVEYTNISCADENDGSITVNVLGGLAPYQYSIDNGTTFQASNEFVGLTPGEYQITVKDANETIVNWDETIVLIEPDTVNIGDDITDCEGQTVTLDAASFESYLWIDESTEPTLEVTISGTYYVTVTDENDCVSSDSIIVTFNPLPTATITSENTTICEGETTDISIELTGTAPWNISYTDGTTPATETTSENPYAFTVSTAGTFEVTAIADANCTGTDFGNSAIVIVNPLPTATITSENATICEGETTDISIELTGTAPWNISYTEGTTPTTEITSENPYVFTVSTAGTYEVTSVADANCTGTDFGNSATVIVNPLPTATITSENATICEGETTDISIELTGTAPWTITYTDGTTPTTETTSENPYVFTVSTAGTYEVTAVGDANCTGTEFGNSAIVSVDPLPNAGFTYEEDNLMVTFTNTSENASSYLWDFGDDNTSTETDPVHTYANAGTYAVELTSTSDNCGSVIETQSIAITNTSIKNSAFNDFVTIIPNPSKGLIAIELNNSVTGKVLIEIVTVNGQVVYKKQLISANKTEQIDLSNNAKGIYFVKVRTNDFEKTGKLIIE